jgi:hypothetical protein
VDERALTEEIARRKVERIVERFRDVKDEKRWIMETLDERRIPGLLLAHG